jgi:hypothetical protein
MNELGELRKCMHEVEEEADFKGYWFCIRFLSGLAFLLMIGQILPCI